MNYHRSMLGLVLIFITATCAYHCDRTPPRATKPKNSVETDKYVIEISGNPKSYVPGENYTISLRSNPSLRVRQRFTEFTLVAELDNAISAPQEPSNTGRFGVFDPVIATFSTRCPNMVLQTNTLPKSSVYVWWVAPETKSGCVAIKGTIFESPDSWFSDDGELTKILCEEEGENEDKQPPVLKHCCACDEAKYEVAFQGMWSRNTHPKDFPTDIWRTKFSDIVGASHKLFKSFWNYGGIASTGLRILAESGGTRALETELKQMVKNDEIRTIIKARELTYPNITGTSYTVFRVDSENHVVSLVSKLTPSPDWIVGVANLELCTKSCEWIESRSLNLYPWDAGTKEGLSYTSDDGESKPQQFIKRIRSNNPNKEESPFFNADGEQLKPLAKLTLTRQKLYEKECVGQDRDGFEEVDPNCATSQWTAWSPCTEHCVKFRQRSYMNPLATDHCKTKLVESVPCQDHRNCENQERISEDDNRCKLSDYSQWSNCSSHCAKGVRTRDRKFLRPNYQNLCSNRNENLQDNEECDGNGEDCTEEDKEDNEDCPNSSWGEWSDCSVTCGTGLKERLRIPDLDFDNDNDDNNDDEANVCTNYKQTVECYNPGCDEEEAESTSPVSGLNTRSQVIDNFQVTTFTDGPVLDCKVSKWSMWSGCQGGQACKRGNRYRERHITRHAQNGGKSCPKKLLKKKRCRMSCSDENTVSEDLRDTFPTWGPSGPIEQIKIDCVMDKWSAWSPCSTNCGGSAVQIRTRGIKIYPSKNGRPCLERKQTRKCPLPISCAGGGNFNY